MDFGELARENADSRSLDSATPRAAIGRNTKRERERKRTGKKAKGKKREKPGLSSRLVAKRAPGTSGRKSVHGNVAVSLKRARARTVLWFTDGRGETIARGDDGGGGGGGDGGDGDG